MLFMKDHSPASVHFAARMSGLMPPNSVQVVSKQPPVRAATSAWPCDWWPELKGDCPIAIIDGSADRDEDLKPSIEILFSLPSNSSLNATTKLPFDSVAICGKSELSPSSLLTSNWSLTAPVG